jgi:hypothetical protein
MARIPSVLLNNTHCDIAFRIEEFVVEAIFASFYYGSTPRTTGNPDAVVILYFSFSSRLPEYIDLTGHMTTKFVHNFYECPVI